MMKNFKVHHFINGYVGIDYFDCKDKALSFARGLDTDTEGDEKAIIVKDIERNSVIFRVIRIGY